MKTYPPLRLINRLSNEYPGCWEEVEDFRKSRGKDLPNWDDSCYIPLAGTIAIISQGDHVTFDMMAPAIELAALAPWRIYKEAYRFTPEMQEMLFEQADDCVIPVEIVENLPFPCVYIELSKTGKHLRGFQGFFVFIEHDMNDYRKELRFLLLDRNGKRTYSVPLHLFEGGTIKDGVDAMIQEAEKQKLKHGFPVLKDVDGFNSFKNDMVGIVSKLLQLMLYICADNTEVDENPEQKKITRKPKSQKFIKDRYREVRKWDVGLRTTKMIRSIASSDKYVHFNEADDKKSKIGTPKRPHSRRGHWHHFWTGKRDSKDRKLVLKWVAPTFVNPKESEGDFPVVVRKIEKEKDNKNEKDRDK